VGEDKGDGGDREDKGYGGEEINTNDYCLLTIAY
jgi:hypothetical protein